MMVQLEIDEHGRFKESDMKFIVSHLPLGYMMTLVRGSAYSGAGAIPNDLTEEQHDIVCDVVRVYNLPYSEIYHNAVGLHMKEVWYDMVHDREKYRAEIEKKRKELEEMEALFKTVNG